MILEQFPQSAKTNAIGMILITPCILALSLGNAVIASFRVDDVIVGFIVNATPALFPPLRISLQLCINHGKIFIHVHDLYILTVHWNGKEEYEIYNCLILLAVIAKNTLIEKLVNALLQDVPKFANQSITTRKFTKINLS